MRASNTRCRRSSLHTAPRSICTTLRATCAAATSTVNSDRSYCQPDVMQLLIHQAATSRSTSSVMAKLCFEHRTSSRGAANPTATSASTCMLQMTGAQSQLQSPCHIETSPITLSCHRVGSDPASLTAVWSVRLKESTCCMLSASLSSTDGSSL